MRRRLRTTWQLFKGHRKSARQRQIAFLLTYGEWLSIWFGSGHFHERGCGKGQYVMARFGDKGAYKVGNVKICTNAENTREGHFKKMSDKHKELIWLGYRKKFPLKEQINCLCGCGQLASPGKKFIHGHAGGLRFRQINKDRIRKPRVW